MVSSKSPKISENVENGVLLQRLFPNHRIVKRQTAAPQLYATLDRCIVDETLGGGLSCPFSWCAQRAPEAQSDQACK